ncbi:glycosyltransferase family 2 protein [Marinobacter salarius]|uniref:glycosyltransferase family 2 protein n=1 Tax=Marinobacter salarius TaxID=1420917 RepID=UPI003D9C06FD
MDKFQKISVVIPARDEAQALADFLPELKNSLPEAEIIVVNDGSLDNTSKICADLGIIEVAHPYAKGNGAAIKSGARAASGDILVFMDGDGQHQPSDINALLSRLGDGYDLVVGARTAAGQASIGRSLANKIYNRLASYMTGQTVEDLTSGFRAVRAKKFKQFLYLLPNGFSYPTTSTMAFFRAGYSVSYVPINVQKRIGRSHIKLLKDGARFLLIIFKIGTLYSPLKLFAPISLGAFLVGICYYGFTYISDGRFTNMSALMLSTSLIIFLIGLVSEQITQIIYSESSKDDGH